MSPLLVREEKKVKHIDSLKKSYFPHEIHTGAFL